MIVSQDFDRLNRNGERTVGIDRKLTGREDLPKLVGNSNIACLPKWGTSLPRFVRQQHTQRHQVMWSVDGESLKAGVFYVRTLQWRLLAWGPETDICAEASLNEGRMA